MGKYHACTKKGGTGDNHGDVLPHVSLGHIFPVLRQVLTMLGLLELFLLEDLRGCYV